MQQAITVLGATGSIGLNTLDVIARHPQRYRVFALTAHQRVAELLTLCVKHRPQYAVVNDERNAQWLQAELSAAGVACEVLHGVSALESVAAHAEVQIVMAAIVGAAGLLPTLAAVRAGKRVMLANKEALVMSGQLFMDAVQQHGATLLPIDSEHNAIWQCLPVEHGKVTRSGVKRIVLTGSGGPFLQRPLSTLASVTPDEACAHPNWSMGRKISVDSATMMNKGLELIEACWLFACAPSMVDVVLHPQSVIHSMVEYIDGSMIAQLGNPDMRTPIAYALAWPERIDSGVARLDLVAIAKLEFLAPDLQRFPCLALAMTAAQTGGSAPAILNAANEVAVQAFLETRIPFTGIAAITAQVLERLPAQVVHEVGVILDIDRAARECAQQLVKGFSS